MKCAYCKSPIKPKSTQKRDQICGVCWALLIQIAKSQPVLRRAQ
jgi:hypothetical protein